jgi:chromatin remodeling complex protein RSC6
MMVWRALRVRSMATKATMKIAKKELILAVSPAAVEGKTLTLSPALSELLNVKALSRGQALKGLWAFIK